MFRFGRFLDSKAQHELMLNTPMTKLVAAKAAPTVISQLISIIYNTADTYFVSRIGNSASAGVGVVFSIMTIIQALGFGIGMGASSLISRSLGAEREQDAYRYGSSAFFCAVLIGFILMALGLSCLDGLLVVLGASETMLPHAAQYAKYILIGAPIMCSTFVLNNILRSEGEAAMAMYGMCFGGILNMVLDPIFIFRLNMGTGGAALATIVSQAASFLVLLSMFLRGRSIVCLSYRWVSRDIRDYIAICKTGMPTIFRQGMASIASALLNINARVYGDAAVAAITIANKVYMLVRQVMIGIGQGFQPIAGYNYGAGNNSRVKEAFRVSCIIGTVICSAAAVVIFFNRSALIGWFRDDTDVIRIGSAYLTYACAVMPFMAYSTFVNQLYQCLGFSGKASFLASCRQGVFFIPLVFILPRLFGVNGIVAVQPGADLCTFLISIPFQIYFYKNILAEQHSQ